MILGVVSNIFHLQNGSIVIKGTISAIVGRHVYDLSFSLLVVTFIFLLNFSTLMAVSFKLLEKYLRVKNIK